MIAWVWIGCGIWASWGTESSPREGLSLKPMDKTCMIMSIIGSMESAMIDTAHIDKIMTEVKSLGEQEKLLLFHKIEKLLDAADEEEEVPIESVFGLWKDRDITLEHIRRKTWRQK
jgi:hypothetical protein